jgi:membrane protein YdbS with pleckstrin-like domain
VLVPALARAFVLALPGGFLVTRAPPLPVLGAVLTAVAAAIALRAVWKWERTRVVVTTERLVLLQGTLRRRTVAVRLDRVGPVEVEQTLLGRLLGYGTLVAGPLAIDHVPEPRQLYGLVQRAGA